MVDKEAMATRQHGWLFVVAVRHRFIVELVKTGVPRDVAREMAWDIDTDTINGLANSVDAEVLQGNFADWLKGGGLAKILEIVKLLMSLFAGDGGGT